MRHIGSSGVRAKERVVFLKGFRAPGPYGGAGGPCGCRNGVGAVAKWPILAANAGYCAQVSSATEDTGVKIDSAVDEGVEWICCRWGGSGFLGTGCWSSCWSACPRNRPLSSTGKGS